MTSQFLPGEPEWRVDNVLMGRAHHEFIIMIHENSTLLFQNIYFILVCLHMTANAPVLEHGSGGGGRPLAKENNVAFVAAPGGWLSLVYLSTPPTQTAPHILAAIPHPPLLP